MKIIGRTETGYLAQITEDEIFLICGAGRYPKLSTDEIKGKAASLTGRRGVHEFIPTNTEINIIMGFDFAATIQSKRRSAIKAVQELREIADLLESPPKLICEPNAPPEA